MHPDTVSNNPGLVHRKCLKAGRESAFSTNSTLASTALLTRPHHSPWTAHTSGCLIYMPCTLNTLKQYLLFLARVFEMTLQWLPAINSWPALPTSQPHLALPLVGLWVHQTLPSAHTCHHPQEVNPTHFLNSLPVHACAQCSCPQFIPQSFKFLGMLYKYSKFQPVI